MLLQEKKHGQNELFIIGVFKLALVLSFHIFSAVNTS